MMNIIMNIFIAVIISMFTLLIISMFIYGIYCVKDGIKYKNFNDMIEGIFLIYSSVILMLIAIAICLH